MSEELRIEVHEAQNIVERLNSVMGFIFYGKLGEISTNVKEYQELSIVCLHLLQACMSYINTIIFQKVLSRPEWRDVLTPEDKRALNVLFHSHINCEVSWETLQFLIEFTLQIAYISPAAPGKNQLPGM